MKVRNLVLGMMLAANVLTAQGAVIAGGAVAAASIAAMANTNASIASSVTTNMMNSQNSVIVECLLKTEQIKKDGEWFGSMRPSLKKTIDEVHQVYKNAKEIENLISETVQVQKHLKVVANYKGF